MIEKMVLTAKEKLLNLVSDALEDRDLSDAERLDIQNRIAAEFLDLAEMFQAFGFDVDDLNLTVEDIGESYKVSIESVEGSGFTVLLKNLIEKNKLN